MNEFELTIVGVYIVNDDLLVGEIKNFLNNFMKK